MKIKPDYYKVKFSYPTQIIECNDLIEKLNLNFNLGNSFKYIWRAGKKNDKISDLRKAITYLEREIENESKKQN